MKNAQSILESKGYSEIESLTIVKDEYSGNSLDTQVRKKYGVEGINIWLWDEYRINGDTNINDLKEAVKKNGFNSTDELFSQMEKYLVELAEKYPSK